MEENKIYYNLNLNFKRKSKQLSSSIDILQDLLENKMSMKDLIKNVMEGKSPAEFRSIMWKVFLQIIFLEEHYTWENKITSIRKEYFQKCENFKISDFLVYLRNYKTNNSGEGNNPNEAFIKCYSNLSVLISNEFFDTLNIIKLDIDRTFQEIDLFRNEEIKESLSKILYIWSMENQDVGYCQGMNEILGTLCYALYPSNIMSNQNYDNKDEQYKKHFYLLNSEEYFEADLYIVYSEIMKRGFKELFNYNDVKYRTRNGLENGFEMLDKTLLTLDDIEKSNHSCLKKRINKIFYFYLKICDKQLFLHLYDKVEPYLFLFRWILCLLNREISLTNIVGVWDCIFAMEFTDFPHEDSNEFNLKKNGTNSDFNFKEHFNFLDILCVAMIIDLKEEIINEDDSCYILSHLMHFPNEHNLKEIIKNAVILRDKVNDYFRAASEFVIID